MSSLPSSAAGKSAPRRRKQRQRQQQQRQQQQQQQEEQQQQHWSKNNDNQSIRNAQDLRLSLLERRQQESIQIRKQRREERLQGRRRLNDSLVDDDDAANVESFQRALESYVSSGSTFDLHQLSHMCSTSSNHTNNLIWERCITEQQQQETNISPRTLLSHFYRTLLHASTTPTQAAVSSQEEETATTMAVYNILLAITSTFNSSGSSMIASSSSSDSYYGRVALRWSDMLLEDPQLLSALCLGIQQQHSQTTTTTMLSHILGNLLQDAPAATSRLIWPYWTTICAHLPHTSYLCAALAQKDATCYAADLIQPFTTTTTSASQQQQPPLAMLLTTPETQLDGAWFWEGLTRREDAVVYDLCSNDALMQTFSTVLAGQIMIMTTTTTMTTASQTVAFVFPAMKTVGNMAVACDGALVSRLWSFLGDTCVVPLVQQGTVMEAVRTAACFLVDVPHNPSSNDAWLKIAPSLLNMVVHGTHEWKKEAVVALDVALSSSSSEQEQQQQRQQQQQQQATMDELVFQVWDTLTVMFKNDFLSALLDVAGTPDATASSSAMRVLDRFLLMTKDGVDVLKNHSQNVSERLYDISCNNNQEGIVADMSFLLLEEFFDLDIDKEEEEGKEAFSSVPNETFVFGMPRQHQQQQLPAPPQSTSVVAGRGRGRPVPAWMAREQRAPGGI